MIEAMTERMRRLGRRRKQLLNELREDIRCWNLKEEALQCSVCEERSLEEPVDLPLRQNTE